MNFKTGDRVKFLNDIGKGKIIKFQDNTIAWVEMDDGFEIPMKLTELVKVQEMGDQKTDTSMRQTVAFKETMPVDSPDQITIKEDEDGVYLAIVKCAADKYTLNIVNDTDYFIFYVVTRDNKNGVKYLNSGELEDNTKIILETCSYEFLKELGAITFQVLLFGKKNFRLIQPINKTIDLKLMSLLNSSFTSNEFYDEKALVIKLENDDLVKEIKKLSGADINAVIKIKDPNLPKVGDFLKKSKKKEIIPGSQKNDLEEVDLHIESIVENLDGMTPAEIINTQLSRFEIALNGAIRNNIRRIVFIHGVGNGKLKYEISKILDRKYPDLRYQDASFREYGYGAMMVILKQ